MITGRVARILEVPQRPAACTMTKGRIQNRAQSVHHSNTHVSANTHPQLRGRGCRSPLWAHQCIAEGDRDQDAHPAFSCKFLPAPPSRFASSAKKNETSTTEGISNKLENFGKFSGHFDGSRIFVPESDWSEGDRPLRRAKAERAEPAAADAEGSALSTRGLGPHLLPWAPQSKHMLSSSSLSPGSLLVKRKPVCAPPAALSVCRQDWCTGPAYKWARCRCS